MSSSADRIAVPTNGKHPPTSLAEHDDSPSVEAPSVEPPSAEDPIDEATDAPRIIVTPGQATVVGFGILAGLILLALGRRRGKG
jgi:hypothetical protein